MTVAISPHRLFSRLRILAFRDDYTRFVLVMKVALPTLAILLFGIVIIWARLAAQTDGFRIGYAAITADSVKNLRMLNARYFGIDTNNNKDINGRIALHPFVRTAEGSPLRSLP